eukprot:8660705-Prorocentrum_lima.AAC.1
MKLHASKRDRASGWGSSAEDEGHGQSQEQAAMTRPLFLPGAAEEAQMPPPSDHRRSYKIVARVPS